MPCVTYVKKVGWLTEKLCSSWHRVVCLFVYNVSIAFTLLRDTMKEMRREAVVRDVSKEWVKNFRKRNGLNRLRRSTTDRAVSSAEDLRGDNGWRNCYNDVVMCDLFCILTYLIFFKASIKVLDTQ